MLLYFVSILGVVLSLKNEGSASLGGNGFSFLGKFCFNDRAAEGVTEDSAAAGVIDIIVNAGKKDLDDTYFVLYDDESTSFKKIHGSGKSCTEKLFGSTSEPDGSDIPYTRSRTKINFELNEKNDKYVWKRQTKNGKCDSSSGGSICIWQHIRPRWWYAYLVNCNKTIDKTVDYNIHWLQTHAGSWNKELGQNENGSNTLYLVYLFIYIILFVVQYYSYYKYKIEKHVHQVIKLLTFTIFCQLMGVLFHFLEYMIYSETGYRQIYVGLVAEFFDVLAASVFLLLLLVLAQGWTITRFDVYKPKIILVIVVFSFLFQFGFKLWSRFGLDSENTKFVYNSIPELGFAGLMIILGVLYCITCIRSFRSTQDKRKRNLFLLLAVFFSLFFLSNLVMIGCARLFNPWVRDIVMHTIKITWDTITYLAMMLLLFPNWAHHYFNLSAIISENQEGLVVSDIDNSINSVDDQTGTFRTLDEERL